MRLLRNLGVSWFVFFCFVCLFVCLFICLFVVGGGGGGNGGSDDRFEIGFGGIFFWKF